MEDERVIRIALKAGPEAYLLKSHQSQTWPNQSNVKKGSTVWLLMYKQ
ncbi:hypothetical protein [Paenibacillus sp. FSL R5-0701]